MAEVDWTVDLFERPVSIDLMEQGHKLEHFLGETIGRPLHIGSRPPSDQIPYPHVEFVARTPDLTSTLNVILLTTGAYALVAGTGEPREEAVAPWRDAVAAALARLHEDDQEHSWAAVIGPMPSGNGVWQHLSAEATVGGLRLLPPEVLYREFIRGHPAVLWMGRRSFTWPVVVEGTTAAFNQFAALHLASAAVHRLCGILSVAFGGWTLRVPPQLHAPGIMKVPPESPWHKPTDDGEPNIPDEPVTVPEWAESAWRALEVDPELGDALAAHQEGLALEQRHPSFALLAFIASIEALGTKLFPVDRCPECKTVRGAAERFRKTLRLVLPEDQVRTLARAYTPRSTTAHRGKLHGVERAFGSLDTAGFSVIGRMMRAMALPAGLQFSWGTVYEMRRASNALLQKALMGNLNPDDGS